MQSRHSYTHPAQRATTNATRVTHTHPPPPLQWPTSAAAAAAARYLSSVSACFRAVSSWRPFSRVPTVPFTWETPPVASGRPTPRRRDEVVRGSPLGACETIVTSCENNREKKKTTTLLANLRQTTKKSPLARTRAAAHRQARQGPRPPRGAAQAPFTCPQTNKLGSKKS